MALRNMLQWCVTGSVPVRIFWGIHLVQVAWSASCSSHWVCKSETGDQEPPALSITKGMKASVTGQGIRKVKARQELKTQEEKEDLSLLRLWSYKRHGVPLLGVHPWRSQLELFLCYCTLNKLLCGTRYPRLFKGKPGVKPVRKLIWSDHVSMAERNPLAHLEGPIKQGPFGSLEPPTLVPAVRISGPSS